MQIRYFDRATGKMQRINIPADVAHLDVELSRGEGRVSVGVNADVISVFHKEAETDDFKLMGAVEVDDLLADYATERLLGKED